MKYETKKTSHCRCVVVFFFPKVDDLTRSGPRPGEFLSPCVGKFSCFSNLTQRRLGAAEGVVIVAVAVAVAVVVVAVAIVVTVVVAAVVASPQMVQGKVSFSSPSNHFPEF